MIDRQHLFIFWCALWTVTLQDACNQTGFTNGWQTSKALDLETSMSGNASLDVISAYTTNSSETCATDCCLSINGSCTVASFQADLNNGTCYLYKCLPVDKCLLTYRNRTDTFFALPLSNTLTTRENIAALVAVHGDGTKSKARKGVLPGEIEESPLKHDNTSIKPRKGVQKEQNTSAVKPRKGVDSSVSLDNVFSDDQSVTNTSVPEVVVSTSKPLRLITDNINVSSAEEVTTFSPHLVTVLNVNETLFTSSLSTHQIMTSTLKSTAMSVENETDFQVVFTELLETNVSVPITTISLATSTVMPVVKVTVEPPDFVEVSNWELVRTSSSLHLVIALVLGLMLLLTVLGVIAKRIHDSWQRRHYHRMDFLIDGMYNGDP